MRRHIEAPDQSKADQVKGQYQLCSWLLTGTLPEMAKVELEIDLSKTNPPKEYMACLPSRRSDSARSSARASSS